MPKLLLVAQCQSDCHIWWRYIKLRPSKISKPALNICEKLHENRINSLRVKTRSVTNERSNRTTTYKPAWSFKYFLVEVINKLFTPCLKKTRKLSWHKGYARQRRHSKMAVAKPVSRRLGFYRTGNNSIRSVDPENPCLELNMEWMHRLRDIRL